MVVLENSRCVLRQNIREVDFTVLHEWLKDFETMHYVTPMMELYFVRNAFEMKKFFEDFLALEKGNQYFYVFTKTRKIAGYVVYGPHTLGLLIGKPYWRKGYGYNAMLLFLEHYFTVLGKKKSVISTCIKNKNAYRLYRKLGYRLVRQVKGGHPYFAKERGRIVLKHATRLFLEVDRKRFFWVNRRALE